jgi:hypothetical protein
MFQLKWIFFLSFEIKFMFHVYVYGYVCNLIFVFKSMHILSVLPIFNSQNMCRNLKKVENHCFIGMELIPGSLSFQLVIFFAKKS